jgi:hypothetical protein
MKKNNLGDALVRKHSGGKLETPAAEIEAQVAPQIHASRAEIDEIQAHRSRTRSGPVATRIFNALGVQHSRRKINGTWGNARGGQKSKAAQKGKSLPGKQNEAVMRQISTGKTKNKMKLVAARKNPYHEEQYYEDKLLLSNTIKERKTDSTARWEERFLHWNLTRLHLIYGHRHSFLIWLKMKNVFLAHFYTTNTKIKLRSGKKPHPFKGPIYRPK